MIRHRDIILPYFQRDSIPPVGIAIIDTGIDITNPWIKKNWQRGFIQTPDRGYRDFLKDDNATTWLVNSENGYNKDDVLRILNAVRPEPRDDPTDISGHGTHLAGIVLQLAPHANLFVARVLENNRGKYDVGAVARRVALVCLLIEYSLLIRALRSFHGMRNILYLTSLTGYPVRNRGMESTDHIAIHWV